MLGNKYKFDFVITEIGGTVGDIESLPYLESIRQLKWELGKNALCVHLTYVPYLAAAGELKTKPTQHSVKELAVCRYPAGYSGASYRTRAQHGTEKESCFVL